MAVTMTRLSPERVLVARFDGRLDRDFLRALYEETAEARLEGEPLYVIIDLTDTVATQHQVAAAFAYAARRLPDWQREHRVRPLVIAPRSRARLLADVLSRPEFGGLKFPVVDTLDEALAIARGQSGAVVPPYGSTGAATTT